MASPLVDRLRKAQDDAARECARARGLVEASQRAEQVAAPPAQHVHAHGTGPCAECDRLRAVVSQLEAALETRDLIGQAKGILMVLHKVDADAAFVLLRDASQRRNVKIRDLALDVTLTGSLDPIP